MKHAHFVSDFEGWPKGNPEFEIHILGQAGTTDSLQSYSCAGERASGTYYQFNMDDDDWTGSVLLLSDLQINAYRTNHPNQNFRVFAVEDDDTACEIRTDPSRFSTLINRWKRRIPRSPAARTPPRPAWSAFGGGPTHSRRSSARWPGSSPPTTS